MTKAAEVIKRPLGRDKSNVKRGFKGEVIRDGGDRGAGLIKNFSAITRGEALGHRMWCDSEFCQQVHDAINESGESGLKCRFTHPSLSADGMGKFLGNLKNASKEGDQVFCDLHISESAHKTPDGDLADYVMTFAEEDPDKFGSSIVFMHDRKSEELFFIEHKDDETGQFKSPDPKNKKNYYHVRLKQLFGADMVDDPAANPGGLFHREQEIAQEATQLMEYVLDLEGATLPEMAQFDVDPDRLKLFFDRFLADHDLELIPKPKEEKPMSTDTSQQSENKPAEPQTQQPAAPSRSEWTAELKRYVSAFGAENGGNWFTEGKSFEDAQTAHIELLNKQLTAKDEKIKDLTEKLAAVNTGEDSPFKASGNDGENGKTLASCFRIAGKN